MIVYKYLLTGDELLSDSFPYRECENGMLWEVDGKWVVQGAVDVNIGANPSAEGGEDEGVDDQAVKVVDIVDTFRLQEQPAFEKKQFVTFMKRYIKNLTVKLEGEKQELFKKHIEAATKYILGKLKDLQFVSEGAPLNSSNSKMFALFITQSLKAGDGCSSSTGTLVPPLWLDSGATHHMVSDNTILINLRNPPPETRVAVADGSEYPVTKVGDIHTEYIKIKDVNVVPGLKMCVVSVRQLAESNIFTTFYKNHAELWLEGTRIGGAIIDGAALLYGLRFLQAP